MAFSLTQDVGGSLLVKVDRMFLLDLRPKIAHDRIYCHVLDFANDLHAPNDLNCDVVPMLHPVLVLPLNKHNKIIINSYSKAIYITSFWNCFFVVVLLQFYSNKIGCRKMCQQNRIRSYSMGQSNLKSKFENNVKLHNFSDSWKQQLTDFKIECIKRHTLKKKLKKADKNRSIQLKR